MVGDLVIHAVLKAVRSLRSPPPPRGQTGLNRAGSHSWHLVCLFGDISAITFHAAVASADDLWA